MTPPSGVAVSAGSCSTQMSPRNRGQRVWKTQPLGGSAALGISPCELDPRSTVAVDGGRRREQRLRVRVVRAVEDALGRAELHDPTEVEHGDPVGQVADDAQVVRDEEVARGAVALQVGQQVENGRLHRHVERRCGLVAHDDARVAGEGAGDRDALLQATRKAATGACRGDVR